MTLETPVVERKAGPILGIIATVRGQLRIIGALIMREMATRYGRQGLGFAWLAGEPLVFCFGVMILWTLTKPTYEHGVRVAPFVMTGYMSLIMIRHMISLMSSAIPANQGLLYHRQIRPVHLLLSRAILEFAGGTLAFVIVYATLLFLGGVELPSDYLLLYSGWLLLTFNAIGIALILTGLALRFEVFERLIAVISYAMIPLSGAFFMAAWLPANLREIYLLLPFVHGIEMVRASVFGEFVETYYNAPYAMVLGASMNIVGLLLIYSARELGTSE